MALTDKLTAIADAVRAKTGGTALLTLDEIVAAIGGISGGSETVDIAEIATGTFSVARPVQSYTIQHGMKNTPLFAVLFPLYWYDTLDNNSVFKASFGAPFNSGVSLARRSIGSNTYATYGSGGNIDGNFSTEITFVGNNFNILQPTYKDADGNVGTQVYKWVAVAVQFEVVE